MRRDRVWFFILCAGGAVALTANQLLTGDGRLIAVVFGFGIMGLAGVFVPPSEEQ